MCTKQEAKEAAAEAIREYMTAPNGDGLTVVEHEMKVTVNRAIAKMTLRFGLGLLATVFISAGAWFTLNHEVADNTESRQQGGRYTLEDHQIYSADISRQLSDIRNDYDDDIREIKDDIKWIREHID